MGTVYKALDTQINEEVAIKLIRPEIAADEKVLERFSNELKLARKISHKNVCRMYHLRKFDLTLEEFDKALAINPKDWRASFYKGDVYFYQDHFEEASRIYQDTLESAPNPEKHLIHLSIADLYQSQGRFQKAFEYYENL